MLTSSPVQSDYTRYAQPAQNGIRATSINFTTDTRIVEAISGGADSVPFGRAVSQGANDKGCTLGGSDFVGISVADPTIALSQDLTVDEYPENDNAGIMVTGDLWVIVGSDVSAGGSVSYNTTTGVLGSSGTAIDSSRWMTSASTGELAVARLGNIAGQS
jgi:hypothetical protein